MSDAEQEPVSRLAVPAPWGGCGVGCVTLFFGATVSLAVYNLATLEGYPLYTAIPSVLWLGLVALFFFATLYEVGVWQSVVCVLGELSRRHFVEASREGEQTVIGFGFTLLGIRIDYVRVPREHITSTNMGSGQGTALAGRDMNDWSVDVWYRDPSAPRKPSTLPRADEEMHLVCSPGAKAATEEWYRAFVAFLQAAGVELTPSEREYEFRTSNSDRQSESRSSGEAGAAHE